MLVPESSVVASSDPLKGHVISMYLATAGAGGSLLGADEKEIIYLVFGIIDLQNNEVSDQSCIFILFKKQLKKTQKQIPEKHVLAIEKEERAQKEIGTLKKKLKIFFYFYKNNVKYNNKK